MGAVSARDFIGKPVFFSHQGAKIGEIVDAWADKYDGMHIRFRIDNNYYANLISDCNLKDTAAARGLSVGHGVARAEDGSRRCVVKEVSVCHRNARAGTVINNTMSLDQYKDWSSTDAYSTSEYLSDKLNQLHLQTAINTAIRTMEPQPPSGNPHVVDTAKKAPQPQQGDAAGQPGAPPGNIKDLVAGLPISVDQKIALAKTFNGVFDDAEAAARQRDESDRKIIELQAALQQKEQETLQVRAAASQMTSEQEALVNSISSSVMKTIEMYVLEADPNEMHPDTRQPTIDAVAQHLKQNPSFAPVLDKVVFASRHPQKRQQRSAESEYEEQVRLLASRPQYKFARTEERVSSAPVHQQQPYLSVNASRFNAGAAAAAAAAPPPPFSQHQQEPEQAPAIPNFFESPEMYQRYMSASSKTRF